MIITLRVNHSHVFVDGTIEKNLYQEFKKFLGYKDPQAIWKARTHYWDGIVSTVCYNRYFCKCSIKKDGMHFPTGLLSLAREFFSSKGISINIIDERSKPTEKMLWIQNPEFPAYDYQDDVIKKSCKQGRGIIKIATGGGKSRIGAGIIAELGVRPFIFYVTSIDLLKQAKDEIQRFVLDNGVPLKVGSVGGGKRDIQDVTVMTVQTAVRSLGEKFVEYDDEDEWLEPEDAEPSSEIADLIHSARGMIADECLAGDSVVITKRFGPKRMDELNNYIGEDILSFNGTSVVWKKITKFINKNIKQVLKIELEYGKYIQCTTNHPLLTQRGWIEAGNLLLTDKILSYVDADAENGYRLKEGVQVVFQNIFLDTKYNVDLEKNGNKYINTLMIMLHFVCVDAEKKLIYDMLLLSLLLKIREQRNIDSMSMDMIKDLNCGILNYPLLKNRRCWGLYLEIHRLFFQAKEAVMQDGNVIMDLFNLIGLGINVHFCIDFLLKYGFIQMEDMEKQQFLVLHPVCLVLISYMIWYMLKEKRKLVGNGLNLLVPLDYRGGYAMMDLDQKIVLGFIQKVLQKKKLNYALIGSEKNTVKLALINQKNITHCTLEKKQEKVCIHLLENLSQNVWNTKFVGIKDINLGQKINVYDINVEDTHCFFANGILVHNCQHWASSTCQIIADHSISARYKFGMSATPVRDMGDDLLIDACFGKTIVDINASFLINKGILVPPKIYFVHTPKRVFDGSYQTVYKQGIVENKERNLIVANVAQKFAAQGRKVLILVKHVVHGEIIETLTPESFFIHGSHTAKERESHIELMRQRKAPITISTSIFDEGVDIKPLDALILAGSGKSPTRALQRIGRVIRTFEDKSTGFVKKDALVIDFQDPFRYMNAHSRKRRQMYNTEPEFEIKDIRPNG